ncbi:hypothetical protein P692DRAFT_20403514 [Suillus brevipes Sb2]|nr:hypothetical protein P692DRAFT_20403514 [Suillus brevipes Sb2]
MPQDGPCSTRVIEGAVTPRVCTARPKRVHIFVSIPSRLDLFWIELFQNSSIHTRLP